MRWARYVILGVLAVTTVFVWVVMSQLSSDQLRVVFLDVGQGDAIFIEAPNGVQVLIDAGPDQTVLHEL